jgi:hypothetical protein
MRKTKLVESRSRQAAPLVLAASVLIAATAVATGQAPEGPSTPSARASANVAAQSAADLPDAPRGRAAWLTPTASGVSTLPEPSPSQHDIEAGQAAPILTPKEKVVMGLRGAFSLFAAGGWLSASGFEQVTNAPPNWGTDRGAFGQRLEDPRYYRLGSGHKVIVRVLYAMTRPLITRNDSGREVPNFALIGGNLAGSVLTNVYYPRANRSVRQTFVTFGDGLAGAAVGNSIAEFLGPVLHRHFGLTR